MLRGEYVRSRQQVKALGMEEVSVAAPAGAAGLGACQPACIEGRGGFEPSMEEKDYSVATSGHQIVSERSSPRGGVAGCEEDPWAGAEAPAPSWIGATQSDPGVGQEDMLSSPSEGRAEALIDATFIVDARRVDCDVDSTSLADAHAQGDPPRIGDTSQA